MKTIVSVRGLEKRYQLGKDNYVDALRGASVDVGAGEMVAIMGPSGCGKSTMLHMMGCLDEPDSGEVWLNGRRVDDLSTRATTKLLREEIGFIFQGFNLVSSMTALDNVALASQYAGKSRREAQKLAREALEAVGLADRAGHRPSELSGRPAAAGGDRPGAGQPARGHHGRRAHRQPGQHQLGGSHRHDARDQPAHGHHVHPGDSRPRRGRGLRPGDPHARRRRHRRDRPLHRRSPGRPKAPTASSRQ